MTKRCALIATVALFAFPAHASTYNYTGNDLLLTMTCALPQYNCPSGISGHLTGQAIFAADMSGFTGTIRPDHVFLSLEGPLQWGFGESLSLNSVTFDSGQIVAWSLRNIIGGPQGVGATSDPSGDTFYAMSDPVWFVSGTASTGQWIVLHNPLPPSFLLFLSGLGLLSLFGLLARLDYWAEGACEGHKMGQWRDSQRD